MIRVVLEDPVLLGVDAILRTVSDGMDPVTPLSRRLELAAGASVLERLQGMGPVPVGGAVVTPGGDLPVPFLIHVVIQSRDEPTTVGVVRRALLNGLRRSDDLGITSLAVPPLGTGAGALDAETSARVMLDTFREHLAGSSRDLDLHIVVAGEYEEDAFRREVDRVFPDAGATPFPSQDGS